MSKQCYQKRKSGEVLNYCKTCMKEYLNEKRKSYYASLSDEEKKKFIEKRNWYSKADQKTKDAFKEKMKGIRDNLTEEEKEELNRKNSEGLKEHWKTVSDEDKAKRVKPMNDKCREIMNTMTPEERSDEMKRRFQNLNPEVQEKLRRISSENISKYNVSLSMEEKRERAKNMQRWHENLTPEQKKAFYERTHRWYYELSEEEKINYALSKREWYNQLSEYEKNEISQRSREYYENLSDEDKIIRSTRAREYWNSLSKEKKDEISEKAKQRWNDLSLEEKTNRMRNILVRNNQENTFAKRFENLFQSSILSDTYIMIPEYMTSNNNLIHSWDYGIFDNTNELVMLVDLDGAYFHADSCDYDGIHSKEEYDEKRFLTIPDGVKSFIIQELNLKNSFQLMMKTLVMNYDEYIENIFKICKSMPFPFPKYENKELIKSYKDLRKMNCNDKYHQDISLNTRIGDRLINHFHESIYRANRKGNISPYDAWQDDKLLRKCIENRMIYQSHLNPNKILQGFNISRISPKVSVFSAGRAKLLIHRYLNEFDIIFDPFSGFSGRMLGVISLGKRYIGQDISNIHVNESNDLIRFLSNYYTFDAIITQGNILDSYGEYPCLFTCPPYGNKEQWLDVKESLKSCDDWIDICLKHFKCKKYLFVVDETDRYQDYIVDEIMNRSHLSNAYEYVVLIEK